MHLVLHICVAIVVVLQANIAIGHTTSGDKVTNNEPTYDLGEETLASIKKEKAEKKRKKVYDDASFTFNMFENFELVSKVFIREQEFLTSVKQLKSALAVHKECLGVPGRNCDESFADVRRLKESIEAIEDIFPGVEDYEGAVKGIVFLMDTYKFSASSLAKGILYSESFPRGKLILKARHKLLFGDVYELTKQAFGLKWYDRAVELLKVSLELAKSSTVSESETEHMGTMKKNLVILNNQHLYKHGKTTSSGFKILPHLLTNSLKKKKDQSGVVIEQDVSIDSRFERDSHFRNVCNGKQTHVKSSKPNKCNLVHHNNPYLKLGPFQVEVASESPFIVVFHHFFSSEEVDFLIDYSKPRLSRGRQPDLYNEALASGFNKDKKVTRLVHKSVQCWIKELEYDKYHDNLHELETDGNYTVHFPLLFGLTKKIEMATGLNATAKYAATDYQTTNYGLGGLCETHFDPHGYLEGVAIPPHPAFQRLLKQGDMMATVMGWLEDVEAGGATAFATPRHEVLVWPKKGSAAFWFDLDKKGHRDTRLLHGGCPIIKGSKWILNKWIYYFDQFKHFPCGLSPNEFNPAFTNHY